VARLAVLLCVLVSCRWGFDLRSESGDDAPPIDPDAGFVLDDAGQLVSCSVDTDCGRCQRCAANYCQRATFVDIGLGQRNGCALDELGEVWCWGKNTYYIVASSLPYDELVPRPRRRTLTEPIDSIAVAWGLALLRRTDGTLRSVGSLDANVDDPATDWAELFASNFNGCARKQNGELHCVGANSNGQLGRGVTGTGEQPLGLFGTAGIVWTTASTANTTCAIDDAGAMFCVGSNDFGELGRGTTSLFETTIAQVGTDTDWLSLDVGEQHVCAIKQNGTLWCWGNLPNAHGGTVTAPVQIGTATDWSSVASAFGASCALRGGTDLWCFGETSYMLRGLTGNLDGAWASLGVTVDPGTPVRIGAESGCVKQAGRWMCWGRDTESAVGVESGAAQVTATTLCE
jgi:hypothetical protein